MAIHRLNLKLLNPCGKVRHYSVDGAEKQRVKLQKIESKQRPSAPPLRVYHCSQCKAYHVGHSS